MPSLKDTKRRIVSVKNTQKITRAMKLVSSAKFTRANHLVLNARPYGHSLDEMIKRLIGEESMASPLLEERIEKKSLLVIVATDRGLCGSLNANLIKLSQRFLDEKKHVGISVDVVLWGRRAEMVVNHRKEKVNSKNEKVLDKPSYEFAANAAKQFNRTFLEKSYDRIYCAYSQFNNALTQTPKIDLLLPIRAEIGKENLQNNPRDFLLEPSKDTLLNSLLAKQIANKLYRILLEGSASEHAARMTAMDNATNNADEVIRRLTLEYNRARQAAITKELIEITSGAEAL